VRGQQSSPQQQRLKQARPEQQRRPEQQQLTHQQRSYYQQGQRPDQQQRRDDQSGKRISGQQRNGRGKGKREQRSPSERFPFLPPVSSQGTVSDEEEGVGRHVHAEGKAAPTSNEDLPFWLMARGREDMKQMEDQQDGSQQVPSEFSDDDDDDDDDDNDNDDGETEEESGGGDYGADYAKRRTKKRKRPNEENRKKSSKRRKKVRSAKKMPDPAVTTDAKGRIFPWMEDRVALEKRRDGLPVVSAVRGFSSPRNPAPLDEAAAALAHIRRQTVMPSAGVTMVRSQAASQ